MARADWADKVDWEVAAANVAEDAKGDWYRDPWGWPEYAYVLSSDRATITARARAPGVKRAARIDVPKGNFATRPAVVLEPLDRLVLQGLTDFVSAKLIDELPSWVYGWRRPRKDSKPYRYADNEHEWESYRSHLKRLVRVYDIALRTDIVSCFASIPVDRACEDIERLSGRNAVSRRIIEMLMLYDQIPGRSGIPQRSLASCVIANMYLGRLDKVLSDYSASRSGIFGRLACGDLVVRWMDDFWIFGSKEAPLRALQFDLQNEARDAGLELNSAKTEVLEGEELASEALRVEHSAVDEALRGETPDVEPLEQLIDRILGDPARADRTSIRFAMTRMRRRKVVSRLLKLVEGAKRTPHGADHLARAFRDFNLWSELQDWYLDYERSDWAKINWAASQFGTMFPTKASVDARLINRFADILSARPQLLMFALTAQRLSSWKPSKARECLRSLVDVADHPLERRLIGIASLGVREEKIFIRKVLSEYEENHLTLKSIESRGFKPFDPVADFATHS